MATYATDLVLVATGSDGSGGTWGEFVGWDGGGAPASETENYIQGAASYSQTFGNPVTGKSIAFDAGSDISSSIPTGDVVMCWVFMGAATNMYSYASGGHRFGIGASLTNFDMWYISGDDRPPNPYGGWWNVAIDPTHSTDATGGTGSSGAWQYFGSLIGDTTLGIRVKIGKGNPHAVDGMLRGRGEIYCTSTGCTFTGMAAENDLVANRWGLLQDTGGGTFLWKGLMSLGQSGTSCTFSDSNKTIVVDDTPKTYADFNKIEINHASSSVTLTNISLTAKGTLAPGNFEMIDNAATMIKTGCSFNNCGTFTYLSNADVSSTTYNSCNLVTVGGGDFDQCVFNETNDSTKAVIAASPAEAALITNCTFNSSGTGHGLEIGGTAADFTLSGCVFTGYDTADPGTAANKAIFVNIASGTMTITISGGSGVAEDYHVRSAGATVTISADTTVTFTGLKDNSEVRIYKVSDDSVVAGTEDATAGTEDNRSFSWAAPNGTEVYYRIHCFEAGDEIYETIFVPSYTVPSTDTSIGVSQRLDRNAEN